MLMNLIVILQYEYQITMLYTLNKYKIPLKLGKKMKDFHVIFIRGVHLGCVDSLGPGQRCFPIHLQDTALSSIRIAF